jgi:hypothetical protein
MGYGLDDIFSGNAISGAASGAIAGNSIVPGIGGIVGGIAGLGLGSYANKKRDDAATKQKSALDQIMANMKAMSKNNYSQHIADLQKTLSYFGPAQQQYNKWYGTGEAAQTGQGDWGNTGIK